MKVGELTRTQIVEVAIACAENAADLLHEAEILFRARRYARSHAVAVLALEEFGKHSLTVSGLLHRGDGAFWSRYATQFTSHLGKLRHARIGVEIMSGTRDLGAPGFGERVRAWAGSENVRKFTGLYVGLTDDGSVVRPSEAISADEARRLLQDVTLVVQLARVTAETLVHAAGEGWDAFDQMVATGELWANVGEARREGGIGPTR